MLLLPALVCAPVLGYEDLKASIDHHRMQMAAEYTTADSTCRAEIIEQGRSYLLNAIALDLFEAWYGTPWDFNGTTTVPRQGHIACGYFLTTILQHSGFRIPRYKWAQLAAEPMIRQMAPKANKTSNATLEEIETWLANNGDGLYAVGLDNHVGFILRRNGKAFFVHSGYYRPDEGVVSEPIDGHTPFAVSRYRVMGKLLDDAMMHKWLTGEPLGAGR